MKKSHAKVSSVPSIFIFATITFLFSFIAPLYTQTAAQTGNSLATYNFILSIPDPNPTGAYSRIEIENFLCALAESFIRAEETVHVGPGKYIIRPKKNFENEKAIAYNQELSKWYEDKVTVTSRGNFTFIDINTIKRFYQTINRIIGQEKFIYQPTLKVANIVIELAPLDTTMKVNQYIGETSILEDNLRVRLGMKNEKVYIDQYTSGYGQLIYLPRSVKLTPEELEFRKKNRFVKVHLTNILDPRVRHFALVHELLHSIGFGGHSPYHASHLFPLPIKAYKGVFLGLKTNGKVLTSMAERMVALLYRPELLPGMSVQEVAHLLPRLKSIEDTSSSEIKEFLTSKIDRLETRKKQLILKGQQNYDSRMSIYLALDRLELKELDLLAELKEIRRESKLPFQIFADLRNAKSRVKKLTRLRQELILLESKHKILSEKKQNGSSDRRKARRTIKLLKEEIPVLRDIINVQEKSSEYEQQLARMNQNQDRKKLELQLRRVIRQQIFAQAQIYTIK